MRERNYLQELKERKINYLNIPENMRDREIYLEAVKQNGKVLESIPEALRSREICLEAVKQYGMLLQFVPEALRDQEICLEAVKKNGMALQFVPEALRSREICLEAVKQYGMLLQLVPEALRDREICLEAIKKDGKMLRFVPHALKQKYPEICLEAVKQNVMALEFIPESLKDREICLKAVKQNGMALKFVPDALKQEYPEICIEAVKQNGMVLKIVPETLRDREICLEAVKQYVMALEFVPEALKDREICLEAVKQNGMALKFVPEALKQEYPEICIEAVKQNGMVLKIVPEALRDRESCLEAVKQYGMLLEFVPEALKDREICLEAVKQNEMALKFVPDHLRTHPEILASVKINITQTAVENKLDIFLKTLGDESVANYYKGLCNAFSFLQFRDTLFNLQNKSQERMKILVIRDEQSIVKMANSYNEFKSQRHRLLALSIGKTEKENTLVEFNQHIAKLYQELSHLRKEKNEENDYQNEIQSVENNLKEYRNQREVLIEEMLKTQFGEDKWREVTEAKDLYFYIHTLVGVFDPSDLYFHVGDKTINQDDYVGILEGLKMQPLPDSLDVVPISIPQSVSATQEFQIAFNFTKNELINFLSNKYDENNNTICPGDLIRLGSTNHATFLHVTKEGIFQFYNPALIELFDNSIESLVNAIERELYPSRDKKYDFMPITMTIFTKTGERQKFRPDRNAVIMKILDQRTEKKIYIRDDATSIWLSAQHGHADIIQTLAAAGADLNIAIRNSTPLYIAAQNGHANVIEVLAAGGADLNITNADGFTPLHIAARCGHANVIEVLAAAGADLNIANADGFTPLHIAVQYGHANVIEALAAGGADLNIANADGFTPLHIAARCGHTNVIEALAAAGADLNIASKISISDISDKLTPEKKASLSICLQKYNIDDDQIPFEGFSALHVAVIFGHTEIVKILLQNGVSANEKADGKISALDLAMEMGCDEICNILKTEMLQKREHQWKEEVIAQLGEAMDNTKSKTKKNWLRKQINSFEQLPGEKIPDIYHTLADAMKNEKSPLHKHSNPLSRFFKESDTTGIVDNLLKSYPGPVTSVRAKKKPV